MFAPVEVPPSGTTPFAAAHAALRAAADALTALAPGELTDAELAEFVQGWDGCFNRLDAARTSILGAFDARCVWAGDAARSAHGWVAARTEQSRPAASAHVRLARALRTMPAVEAACRSGRLGQAKARLLADAARQAPDTFAQHESFLVEQVEGLRVDEAAKALAFWARHANPDGAAERDAKHHADRSVHLSSSFNGMWLLNGKLTPEAGEVLRHELDRRSHSAYLAEKELADANGTTVTTTAAQRRADALLELALQSLSAPEDGTGTRIPALTALINTDNLVRHDARPGDVVGETTDGHPVTATTARRWACHASIARVVLGPDSVPVDLGTTARLPSPAQRRALTARDQGCVFPGCDRPPGATNAHHLVHWIDGGPTDLHNLVLLCSFHHHRVHEGGFSVTRLTDGALSFTRPDGTPLTVPKQRARTATPPPGSRQANRPEPPQLWGQPCQPGQPVQPRPPA